MASIREIFFYCYFCKIMLTLNWGSKITKCNYTSYKICVLRCYPLYMIKEINNLNRNKRTSNYLEQYVRRFDNNVSIRKPYFISDEDLYKKYLNQFLNYNKEQGKDIFDYFPQEFQSTTPPYSQKGPFYDFIVNLCRIIINDLSSSKSRKYLSILRLSLRNQPYEVPLREAIRIFSKTIDNVTILKGKALKQKVRDFLSFVKNKKPRKKDFLVLMNSIYNVYQSNKMDEYLYNLKKYAARRIRRIRSKTVKIIQKVIIRGIYEQPSSVKKNINAKFRLALIEYLEEQ